MAGPVKDNLIEALRIKYEAAKEEAKAPSLYREGQVVVEIMEQGKIESQLMRNIEFFSQSNIFRDARMRMAVASHCKVSTCKPLYA